ncbi:MAG: serine/threonine protein kinase [Gemmatimonadaceae bacterium]|nr:serine/threonine protein kinase [Gemmatimonadaceae bacterium]
MTSPLPAPQSEIVIPDAVRAAFDIVRPLGQGGMGSVWLARDRMLDRLVAIKVLLTSAASEATRDRFLREARTAAKLSHPHIVPVHRADESNGQVWFSMGFVEGESLGDRIRERGALPVTDVVRIMRETAWALAYAHARGVIHRDVKPDNILIDRESGRTVVTDFGIARDLRSTDARLTADGSVLGTVHYMSPEQASDDALDARSDVYSLGVVGFHALSNRLPFEGTPNAVLVSHVTKAAPSLRSVAPMIPGPIAAVIDKCLAKEPGARWENAEALADALGKALDEVVTAERSAVSAGSVEVLTERDAAALWQRAAQLQAEAAHRMERSVTLGTSSREAGGAMPTDAYRLKDVEAAAVEAGISRQFVAIALAERNAAGNAGALAVAPLDVRTERRITTMLGTTDRSISVSRVIKASPKATLQLVGRVFTAQPYMLKVTEIVNGHPLDGGILRFAVPNLYKAMSEGTIAGGMVGTAHGLIYQCSVLDLASLNVTLKARGSASSPECEVIVSGDLRDGQRKNLKAAYWSIGGVTTLAGGVTIPIGLKLLGALTLASPIVAGVAIVAAFGTGVGYRAAFRRALRKVREEMDKMLLALQQHLDTQALFGDLPAPPLVPQRHGDDNAALITMIS